MQKPFQKIASGMAGRPRPRLSRPVIVLGTAAALVSLLGVSIWIAQLTIPLNRQVIVTNGADRWANDQGTTAATIPFASPETLQIPVDPAFTTYYQAHGGARLLGAPVTAGFPIAQGWIQFFTSSALLRPETRQTATAEKQPADKQVDSLIQEGLKDSRTGLIQLPLLHTLLTVGSQARVGGGLTYADLRNATKPDQMKPPPTTASAIQTQSAASQGVFIQGGMRDGKQIGHIIPATLWAFINRPDVSPDGWQNNFGAPLTEAIPFVTTRYGVSHRMLIQAFWRGALVMDRDTRDASGQPIIQPLDTGVAYLQTLTPPTPALGTHTSLWATGDIAILNAPGTGTPILHVGQHFPLTLTGQAQWNAGTLWYHVRWKGPRTSGEGWAPAIGTSFAAPGNAAAWASFDLLSPDLAQYLASQGNHTGAVVYDLTRRQYYAYRPNSHYLMGHSVKLPILLAFLSMTEQQGRHPGRDEIQRVKAMFENTDGEAGEELYGAIGWGPGLAEYMDQLGISGLKPDSCEPLYSLTQPLAMVQLLTLLYEGKILTPQDRSLVFSLLEQATPTQQTSAGFSRPQGAALALKEGWVMGTDSRWAINSSGIVTTGGETYIISVYSAHLNSLEDGQAITRQVSERVAALLP